MMGWPQPDPNRAEENHFKIRLVEALGKAMKEADVSRASLHLTAGSTEITLRLGEQEGEEEGR